MGEIKIVKEKKATDYTFVDGALNLGQSSNEKEAKTESKASNTKGKNDVKLRADKITKIKHKSKITGGRSMQGHSPIYE
jgi:hypothetical protein